MNDYEVNEVGIITSPGKFEGEMYYMPDAYRAYLDGACQDDGEVVTVTLRLDNGEWKTIRFVQDDQGFINEV